MEFKRMFVIFLSLLTLSLAQTQYPESSTASMLYSDSLNIQSQKMAMLANGYIGAVVGNGTLFAAGVFNGKITTPVHRARIPFYATVLAPFIVGETMYSLAFESALDLTSATFYCNWTIRYPNSSSEIDVRQEWFAHRTRRSLMIIKVSFDASSLPSSEEVQVGLSTTLGLPSDDIIFRLIATISLPNDQNIPLSIELYEGQTQLTEKGASPITVAFAMTNWNNGSVFFSPYGPRSYDLFFITAVRSSLDSLNPTSAALADLVEALEEKDILHEEHIKEWKRLWTSGIELQTVDKALQIAVNASLYALYSSARSDWPWSYQPEGLSVSDVYFGHTFWDADFWMYPPILILHPELAETVLNYRFNHVSGALSTAQFFNYSGAMFPWESAFTGHEVCFDISSDCWIEIHITGDVAFSFQQYWRMTRDLQWLKDKAWPVLYEISKFWESRVEAAPASTCSDSIHPAAETNETTCYVINNVRCVDEYANHVNNCVFTNAIAQFSLEFTAEIADILNKSIPESWKAIAKYIKIPFDQQNQIHLEYDGYSQGQKIKQADVTLLAFPLQYPMSKSIQLNDLLYYASVTDPAGPAMTWSMYAVDFLQLGYEQEAFSSFNRSYQPYVHPPFGVWWETESGGAPNFITGAGGFLQGILFGYVGMRLRPNDLLISPTLPPTVSEIKVRSFAYRGNTLALSFDSTFITIVVASGNPQQPLTLTTAEGQKFRLFTGGAVKVPVGVVTVAYDQN